MAPLIELEHVIDALQGFKRPLREGREAVKNLVVCGIAAKSRTEIRVEALCVRTTKISEPPVNIKVIINPSNKVKVEQKIISLSCSCPSGASKEHSCKHALACLLYLERNDESELEQLTCTDIEQRWGGIRQQTMNQFEPVPLNAFCHIGDVVTPYRRPIKEVTQEMELKFRNMFIQAQPNSEAAVFLSGVRLNDRRPEENKKSNSSELPSPIPNIVSNALSNGSYVLKFAQELGASLYANCSPEEKDYYDSYVKIAEGSVTKICLDTVNQDDDQWLEYKYGRLTGSICYSYHTYYKNRKTHSDIDWRNKIKATFSPRDFANANMDNGKMNEPKAKQCYQKKFPSRKIFDMGIFLNPMAPWLGYSSDGVVSVDGNIDRLWEVKTPEKGSKFGADTICSAVPYMKDNRLKEKTGYYGQIQLGMLLLSLPICDFSVYCHGPDELYVDTVVFNEKFCKEMVENLTHAFFTKILPWLVSQVES